MVEEANDVRAAEAVALFCYQVKKWIGAFAAALGGLDTLVFAGGIGENAPVIRARICEGLGFLGIQFDEMRNAAGEPVISADASRAPVRVIPPTKSDYRQGGVPDHRRRRRTFSRSMQSCSASCAHEPAAAPALLQKMNAYWRAANYLSVGQIYLYDNPLLKKPLKHRACEAAPARPLGHHSRAEFHLRPPQSRHQGA